MIFFLQHYYYFYCSFLQFDKYFFLRYHTSWLEEPESDFKDQYLAKRKDIAKKKDRAKKKDKRKKKKSSSSNSLNHIEEQKEEVFFLML